MLDVSGKGLSAMLKDHGYGEYRKGILGVRLQNYSRPILRSFHVSYNQ